MKVVIDAHFVQLEPRWLISYFQGLLCWIMFPVCSFHSHCEVDDNKLDNNTDGKKVP